MALQLYTYMRLSSLTPNTAYKIWAVFDTIRSDLRGRQIQCVVSVVDGVKYKIILPQRFATTMSPIDVVEMQQEIDNQMNPYLIYRGKFPDGSFNITILNKNPLNDHLYVNGLIVPAVNQ